MDFAGYFIAAAAAAGFLYWLYGKVQASKKSGSGSGGGRSGKGQLPK